MSFLAWIDTEITSKETQLNKAIKALGKANGGEHAMLVVMKCELNKLREVRRMYVSFHGESEKTDTPEG